MRADRTVQQTWGSGVKSGHIAVVMPAYNEADGIAGFLREIRDALADRCERLDIIVADDRSTDRTADVVRALDLPGVSVQTQAANRGHGPTALAAYRAGVDSGAPTVVHVDGDGQFTGADIARVAAVLQTGSVDVVHGVRRGREDPWYRRALSAGLRVLVRPFAHRAVPDINTPLRAYRSDVLVDLMDAAGRDALVPHVHFSLAEARRGLAVRYVPVQSMPRRGDEQTGTMWGAPAKRSVAVLPPKRLRSFAVAALIEVWRVSLRPAAPMRAISNAGSER